MRHNDLAVRCASCGQFISDKQLADGGGALFHYIPDSDRSRELCEWECKKCVEKRKK